MSDRSRSADLPLFWVAGCPVLGLFLAGVPVMRALEAADYPGWVVALTGAAAAGAASGLLVLLFRYFWRRIRA